MGKPAQRSRTLIDPRKSKRIGYWDGLTSLALIYTALVTPAEVALLECATSALEPFFMINRVVDGIFMTVISTDMILARMAGTCNPTSTRNPLSRAMTKMQSKTPWSLLSLTSTARMDWIFQVVSSIHGSC